MTTTSIDHTQVAAWLKHRLANCNLRLKFAALFGSLARGSVSPNDCDLLLIVVQPTTASEWRTVTSEKRMIQKEFIDQWQLPLSVTIMTPEEASEDSDFNNTVLTGELIEIVRSTSY